MALKALSPAPQEPLGNGWDLVASEGGRSNKGLQATITLFNGTAQACHTLAVGDSQAQQALATAFAGLTGLDEGAVTHALVQLSVAVEGVLRQMETQGAADEESQATRLVGLALSAGATLFHTGEGEAYATIEVDGHEETWQLKVKGFRRWLARKYYMTYEKTPGSQALQDALGVLEGKALWDGPECPVYTRLAEHQGAIYLDLANDKWEAVEITASGWKVIKTPPVKFRRSKGMLPLPAPVGGGTLADLRPFVNVASDSDWRLLMAWLIAALRPTGPYAILVVYGEQGSAKSTLFRLLRRLLDPNKAALRATPRDERDLVIAATNGWLIALDNLSHLPDWLSDALCRLSTGTGFATRELYTDAEETIFEAQRAIAINGIEEVGTRADFLDRAIVLYLPTITKDKRQDQKQFWRNFEAKQPEILGVLLTIVSAALRQLPTTPLADKPRMADFALWACAAADACGWTAEDFLGAYQGVRDAVHELTLEVSPVGPLVRDFATQQHAWDGTASDLLTELETLARAGVTIGGVTTQAPQAGSDVLKQKKWPKDGRALSNALRRLAPTLRAVGVDVTFDRAADHKRRRIIRLSDGMAQDPTAAPDNGTPEDSAESDEREQEIF